MKTFRKLTHLSVLFLVVLTAAVTQGATTIVSDAYSVTTSGTGFGLNAGVNTGINPPTTRLTGSAAANLRYFQTFTNRTGSHYDINSNRLRVTPDSEIGRFALSANGSSSFDFGPALGSSTATPDNPASYDVKIGMRNDATGNSRFTFGIATAEGDVNVLDFGVQVFRASSGNNFYTIQKRVDRGSFNGTATADGTGDVNATMVTAQANTAATMIDFLIRVTDAGLESGSSYNSRIQVSTNNGSSWIYDTDSDAAVSSRFRFDGTGRHFVFDQAGNTTGAVYYDAFSVTWNSGPRAWTGAGANGNWNNVTNWGGALPVNGSALDFSGTTRQTSTNDLSSLSVPWLTFNNGGFALYGNALTVTSALTNTAGNSSLNGALTLGGAVKLQSVAGTLTVAGGVTGGANNLTVDGAGNTTVSSAVSGSGSLTKNGAGTLQLSGSSANTLSGNTALNVGTLSLAKTAGVNAIAGHVTVGDGTGGAGADVLQLNASNQIADSSTVTVSASGSLNLNGFDETVASVSGASSASQIALGAGTLTVGNGSAITFAGTISGSGNIVKQGSSTLTLSGANTFSGTATISAGVLNVQNATALGSTGATVVNPGTALEIQGGISISGEPLTLNGTGISSAGALRNISGNNNWSGAVTLGSATTLQSDSGTLTISGAIGGGQNLTVSGSGNTTVSSVISGAGSLTKDGSGTTTLSGASANTYSGGTTVNAGTLSLAKTAGVNAIAGNLTIGDGSGTDVVQLSAANQIADSAAVTISAGGTLDLNGNAETVASVSSASSTSQIALGAGTLTLGDVNPAAFAGAISGTGDLVKQGAGTLTLSGASGFSGTATISAGVVNIQNATALGSTGATTVSSGTALEIQGGIAVSGEPLTLNGSGISSGGALRNISGNNSWSGTVTFGAATTIQSDFGTLALSGSVAGGGQNLTVGGAGNTAVSGVISGGGTLTKAGSGTLTLTGANTYSGNTTIGTGTLALGSGSSIASSPVITISTGTTFDVSASSFALEASQTLARNATASSGTINGSVTLNSGATVSLQADGTGGTVGSLSVTGGLTLNSNTITISVSGSALGEGTYTLISYTGSKSGSFNSTPAFTGAGIAIGMAAQIVEAGGQINLQVSIAPKVWSGSGVNGNWSTGANWAGLAPVTGDNLTFSGTTRPTNTNDISGLSVPWVTFNNGGFSLYGNTFTNTGSVTNLAGVNTLNGGLTWDSTAAKTWSIASGSELILNNTTTIAAIGDHSMIGGGTLRLKGTMNFSATPVFAINEGKHIIDGGTFNSIGGYRINSLVTGSGGQTILTNGASFTITATGGGLRVGDSANPVTARLDMDNSTLALNGGVLLAIPYAAGATSVVNQTGGTVSGCIVSFNDGGVGNGSYTIKNGTLVAKQIRENNVSGSASIYFDNAILRTEAGANSTFMTGLNTAQIQSGGLTIDATTADITIGQAMSGTGALTKTGSNKVTFTGANTYSSNTVISAGTLALGTGGSIASSPTITLANGTTFDVSAISYSVGAAQTLIRNSTSSSASINGSVTFASGAKASFQASGSGTVGSISVTGGLTLNGNVISVNVTGSALGVGTYSLISYTGSKSGSFNAVPTITGSGIGSGLSAAIVESSGQISLSIYSPTVPAHGIAAASIKVVENDLANTTNSVTVTTTVSINGLQIRDGSNRGDLIVQVGSSSTDDVAGGVLITSVAENGKDHGEDSGINYCTSAMNTNSTGYFIPTTTAADGSEYNINVSAGYFPYNKYLGGYARNSSGTSGGANNLLTGSSGINLGTQFVDNGGGTSTVNLASFGINSQTDGILLVTAGANDNHFALSEANTNGTWSIYTKDSTTDGAAYERAPVAFAFIPKTNVSVISGKFDGNENILMYSGDSPKFSVTNTTNGTWQLSIPGYSPSSGVLIISAEGGNGANVDNIVSFQPSGNNWLIQSRDLPGQGLQALTVQPVVSFVFIPAPQITLVTPANNSTVSTSPTLKVTVTNKTANNMTVTFYGHNAGKPGPGEDFLIPVLPDTQNYSDYTHDGLHGRWYEQTDWIIAHRDSDNIPYVAQLGDLVQHGDTGGGNAEEWGVATNAMYRLEKQSLTKRIHGIPYGCCVGNHDQEPNGDEDGTTTYYNNYFGSAHFAGKPYYGGHYSSNGDTFYNTFSVSGLDFIVFSYEFGRYGSGVLDWTDDVLANYPNHRIIVMTHHAGSDYTPSTKSAQGTAIFDRLKTRSEFFMMLGGHVFNGDGWGEGSRSDTVSGHTIRTLITDYQNRPSGGDSLMRLMYFSPSNNTVSMKTFSPHTGDYETDADSQFSFTYNMQPNGAGQSATAYAAIKTNLNVTPGSQPSYAWTGLAASKNYEWYVVVTDSNGDYATSTEWKFSTSSGFSGDENPNAIPSAWQTTYGITDQNADDDGDGQNNLAEYIANTNPKDATSSLRILDVKTDAAGQATLTWSSVGGVRYRIQYANGVNGEFVDLKRDAVSEMDSNATGTASTQSFAETLGSTNAIRFYRVKVIHE